MTTATKSSLVAPIVWTFLFNDNLALRALEGLTQEELWRAPTDRNNGLLWVAGHLVQTRAMILRLLGEPVETGWGDLFERGAKVSDARNYPERDEVEASCGTLLPASKQSWRHWETSISPDRQPCNCLIQRRWLTNWHSSLCMIRIT